MIGHWGKSQEQVVDVNADGCNDEDDDDVDDVESEYEYISDSHGEFNKNLVNGKFLEHSVEQTFVTS